jgi:hypothetical protein
LGPIPYEQRRNTYCGSSCFASVTNRNRAKPCVCGAKREKNRKYCGRCWSDTFKYRNRDTSSAKTDHARRAFLLRTREYRCTQCKNTEWMGQPIPLEMDHIDGNPSNNEGVQSKAPLP